jgi:NADH-quinone oxidoreductase subunit G
LVGALDGRRGVLATTSDLYSARALLVVGADLAQQHPLLAFRMRANARHHQARAYVVTPGPVREDQYAVVRLRAGEGGELAAVESLFDALRKEPDLLVVFGDAIRGDAVRRLVAFGDSLGIPVKYVCLVDYSNSRGAADMGLLPDLLPGYEPAPVTGMALDEMLAAPELAALWVIGANPLETAELASQGAFVVVQDLFLTETARRANVVLPAASAYEKTGTVTNVCGEVQRLVRAVRVMGVKTDLEIFGLLARQMGAAAGVARPDKAFEEIRTNVRGYDVALPVIATGGAAQTAVLDGRVPIQARPDLIRSARDTLFTSGSLGRYSKVLASVLESPGGLYKS